MRLLQYKNTPNIHKDKCVFFCQYKITPSHYVRPCAHSPFHSLIFSFIVAKNFTQNHLLPVQFPVSRHGRSFFSNDLTLWVTAFLAQVEKCDVHRAICFAEAPAAIITWQWFMFTSLSIPACLSVYHLSPVILECLQSNLQFLFPVSMHPLPSARGADQRAGDL